MDIHERLTKASQMVKERDRLLHQIKISQNIIREEKKRRDSLNIKLLSEGRDIERLDGITLSNLWHTLRSTKDLTRHKEQEEYLLAKLKVEEADNSIQFMEKELVRLTNSLKGIGDPEAEYRKAIREKEENLLRSGGVNARLLFEMADQLGVIKAEIRELEEAISAGKTAKKALISVEKKLGSAQGWGVVDILGGGLITTAIKHSHITDARKEIGQAQQHLRNFQRELTDVNTTEEAFNIGQFSTLADFILDGFLFDLIVQSQINKAADKTRRLKESIESSINDLENILQIKIQKSSDIEARKKEIILLDPSEETGKYNQTQ